MDDRFVLGLILATMLFVAPVLGQISGLDVFRNVIGPISPTQFELVKLFLKGAVDEYYLINGYNSYKDAESYFNSGNYVGALPAINNSIEDVEKIRSFIFKDILFIYYKNMLSDEYCMKGAILNELKRYNEALIFLNKSIDKNYKNAYAWNNKGNAFYHLGNYGEAINDYDFAVRLDPSLKYAAYSKKCLAKLKLQNESVEPGEDLICKCMGLKTKYIDSPNSPQPTCVAEGNSNLGSNSSMSVGGISFGSISPGNQSNQIEEQWRNRSSGFTY